MDPFLAFFTWQFMLFSLSVAGMTFILRTIVDYFLKNLQDKTLWENLILPIFPLILGCLMGWLIPKYPFPDGLISLGGHIIFGMVAGMFSGVLYRAFKAILNVKISTDPTSLTPAPLNNILPTTPVCPPNPEPLQDSGMIRKKQP